MKEKLTMTTAMKLKMAVANDNAKEDENMRNGQS